MPTVIWIALGGALGAVSRWGVSLAVTRVTGGATYAGTFLVNVLGCFALGAFLEIARSRDWLGGPVHALVAVGFLGAFTTFSTFALDTDALNRRDTMLAAGLYAGLSVLVGVAAFVLARTLFRAS